MAIAAGHGWTSTGGVGAGLALAGLAIRLVTLWGAKGRLSVATAGT
jgi:DHA1 family inner membrane transport protein